MSVDDKNKGPKMQTPKQLTDDEVFDLLKYLAYSQNKSTVTTTARQPFTFADHAQLAYSIWQRMGKDANELHRSWCAMFQSNPSVNDVMALVAYHVTAVINHHN